jgi:MFS family permease
MVCRQFESRVFLLFRWICDTAKQQKYPNLPIWLYNTPMTQALQEPTERVTLGFQILLGLANASTYLAVLPILTILIPAQVTQIDLINSASNLALVLSLGAVGALIGNPLGGALSDRTTAALGRRRPWIIVGTLATSAWLAILANSQSVLWLALGWFSVQLFGNMLFSAYGAILPDRIPVNQRGTTQAILSLISPIFMTLGAYYLGRVLDFRVGYYPVILVLLLCNVLFVGLYREIPLPKGSALPFRLRSFLASFWINPRQQPTFGLAWLAWLLIWTGYGLGTGGFLFLYIQNVTGYESVFPGHTVQEGLSNVQILQTLCGIPLMMLIGALSDRFQRRKIFVISGIALVILGMFTLIFFSNWTMVMIAATAIGVGFSIFFNLGMALVSQILPSASDRGKDLGVINIASTIPQIVMPGIGAAVINVLGLTSPVGYQILFGTGILLLIIGAILTQNLRGVR